MGTRVKFGGPERFLIQDVPGSDVVSFPQSAINYDALSPSATSNSVIRFQPGYTGVDPRICSNWSSLMTAVSASVGPPYIYIDNAHFGNGYTVPSGTWDFRGATLWAPYDTGSGYSRLIIPNGAQISNLARIAGCMTLVMANNTVNAESLGWTDNQGVGPSGFWPTLVIDEWVTLEQSGSQPGMIIDANRQVGLTLDFKWHGWFNHASGSNAVRAKAGSSFEFAMSTENYPSYSSLTKLLISEGSNSFWIGNGQKLANPGTVFPGIPSASLYYDRLHGDALSTSEATIMIPNIALQVGDWYYNTTAKKPYFWDGAAWRDAVGVLI